MFSGISPLSSKHVIKQCKKRVEKVTLKYTTFAKALYFVFCIAYVSFLSFHQSKEKWRQKALLCMCLTGDKVPCKPTCTHIVMEHLLFR